MTNPYTPAELERFNRDKLGVIASMEQWQRNYPAGGTYADHIAESENSRFTHSGEITRYRSVERRAKLFGLPGVEAVITPPSVTASQAKPTYTKPPARAAATTSSIQMKKTSPTVSAETREQSRLYDLIVSKIKSTFGDSDRARELTDYAQKARAEDQKDSRIFK